MINSKEWKVNQNKTAKIYKTIKDEKERKKLAKPFFEKRKELLNKFGLNEYSLHNDVKVFQKNYKKNINSHIAQKTADQVWQSYEKIFFGNDKKIYFKSYNKPLNSLENKNNKTGIIYDVKNNILKFQGLNIKVQSELNDYETKALENKICYCRIVRKFIRGKYKCILQLILEGVPPLKYNKDGSIKNDIGKGECGIDNGTQTMAYTADTECKLMELCPRIQNIENEKRKIQRYMDRSRRINNPKNFNEDGTVKRGIKLIWRTSKKYLKAKNKLKGIQRKQADIRKLEHNILANKIISKCSIIKTEKISYKGLQRKSKKTTTNEKTKKFNKKKRFGKSIANKAPAMFLNIIKNKITAKGGVYIEINTQKTKCSQYNHLTNEYIKKELKERWNIFNYKNKEIHIQRDLYSSFLIKNTDSKGEKINRNICNEQFDDFLEMHNKEIERLKQLKSKHIKIPASIGI